MRLNSRNNDDRGVDKGAGVMSIRKKDLIIVSIAVIAAIALGTTLVVSGRMSIKDPDPERASDPNKEWIGDNEAPNNYDFVKENMQDVTYRIDGKDMVFAYVKSTCSGFDKELCLDENMEPLVTDYYDSAEGYTVVKYEGSERINGFYTNDYSPVRGDENTEFVGGGAIKERALEIITGSDTDMQGLESAKVAWDDQGTNYSVTLTCESGRVHMYMATDGALQSFSLTRSSTASEERKEAAREKLRDRIEELEKANPQLKYNFEEEEFFMLGDENYAMFTVTCYEKENESASYAIHSDVINYFCIV